MRPINRIVVHCSATEPGMKVNAKIIDGWHRNQGYKNGIGYHYVILEDGTIEKGRAEAIVGAHALGYNNNSIGICYCGGLRNGKACDTRTPQQRESLKNLIIEIYSRYDIKYISGHNQLSSKACPCFDVTKEYKIENDKLVLV